MTVGTLRCVVINVTDLETAIDFWSHVAGLEIIGPREGWHGWLCFLGTKDPRKHEIILQKVDSAPVEAGHPSRRETNPIHIDITPNDGVDAAMADIVALGGTVKKAPSLYPRPGSHGAERPRIDWAVMQDPFGNEFCLVWPLTQEQAEAAMVADATTDREWRVAAGVTEAA